MPDSRSHPWRLALRSALLLGLGCLSAASDTKGGSENHPATPPAPQTLRSHWQGARQLLLRGEPAAALQALDALSHDFADEPEYQQALPQLLPLYAELCLSQGRFTDAAQLCQQWLALGTSAAGSPEQERMLEMLATACEHSDDFAGAIAALRQLLGQSTQPDAPLAQLSRLRLAFIHARSEATAEAFAALTALSTAPAYPAPLQAQARLYAIYLCLETGSEQQAADLLLSYDWQGGLAASAQPIQLSLAAQRIATALLSQGLPHDALSALALVAPAHELRQLQTRQLEAAAASLRAQQQRAAEGSVSAIALSRFFEVQLAQLNSGLQALELLPEHYALSLLFTRAQAHLQVGQAWEAAILFQAAGSAKPEQATATSVALARQAQFQHLIALRQSRREQTLQTAATTFARRHTGHPLAAQARYLQAESLRRQKYYTQAITALNALLGIASSNKPPPQSASPIETEPAHSTPPSPASTTSSPASTAPPASTTSSPASTPPPPASTALWHFERGYCHALLGDYTAAQADFEAATAHAPAQLLGWAHYWAAQTRVLAADYPQAEVALQHALQLADPEHPATPHARFALAQALYANNKAALAEAALASLLASHPDFERKSAARLLLAEALVAQGQTQAAIDQLATARSANIAPWTTFALLRQAELLQARGDSDAAVALLLASVAEPQSPAAAAHVSQYGDIMQRAAALRSAQGQRPAAVAITSRALLSKGNDPAAGDFSTLFAQAWRLSIDPQTLAAPMQQPNAATMAATAAAPTGIAYPLWLEQAREGASARKQGTLYSRLSLALSRHYEQRNREDLSLAPLLQAAAHTPVAEQDTASLEAIAIAFAERNHSAAPAYTKALALRLRTSANAGTSDPSGATQQPAALLWSRALLALHGGNPLKATEQLRLLEADWPTHPLRAKALLLRGDLQYQQGDAAAALADWQSLLGLPTASHRQRASALLALARHHAAAQSADAAPIAIAYYQRLYTLYRADSSLLIAAYRESALLFEQLGKLEAAAASYEEMLTTLAAHLSPKQEQQAIAEQTRLLAALKASAAATAPAVAAGGTASSQQSASPVTAANPATAADSATAAGHR